MFKLSTYNFCSWWKVPYVNNEELSIVEHIRDIPPPRSLRNKINENLVDQFGFGTEENPLKIERKSSIEKNSNEKKRIRLICLSDTHNKIDQIRIPDGDIFIHCGDPDYHWTSLTDLRRFNQFVGNLSHRYKLFVSGNHCVSLDENRPDLSKKILSNLIYLQDEFIEIEGIRFYGTPWIPKRGCFYRSSAFNYDHRRIGEDKWSLIPSSPSIDILLTHCPPYGIRDYSSLHGNHLGCFHLFEHLIQRIRPQIHLFGHVHDSFGISLFQSQSNQNLFKDFSSFNDQINLHEDFQIFFINLSIQRRRTLGQPIVIDYFI